MAIPVQGGFKFFLSFLLIGFLFSCSSKRIFTSAVVSEDNYKAALADTASAPSNQEILMPYNRFIDPAGTVIQFGDPSLENHSLDVALLPDEKVLVAEDRYGITFFNIQTKQLLFHLDYEREAAFSGLMSTYSGVKVWQDNGTVHVFWSAANPLNRKSFVIDAVWDGTKATFSNAIPFAPVAPSPMALPNDVAIANENGESFLYVALNGNNQLSKIRLKDKQVVWTANTGMAPYGIAIAGNKLYVTNWAGPVPTDKSKETAGIPYASVYIDPRTGATAMGTVSVLDRENGKQQSEIQVGLHPNAILTSPDGKFIYVANSNSDQVSVISTETNQVTDSIPVRLNQSVSSFGGAAPNGLTIDSAGTTLYVANGLNNAIAVVKLGSRVATNGKGHTTLAGYIPTEAYPAGLALSKNNVLYIANLEGEGARAATNNVYTIHQQQATISIIPVPGEHQLKNYTARVEKANFLFREKLSQQLPRSGVAPKPVPERIGEPSVFKHVVYIIKENKTYDQVFGDMAEGNGMKSLCIFGDSITPNQHRMAKEFSLLDSYYASGKSSAEGHQWTDAAMVSDYVEKNVRAWFRSYPHVQTDALVYNQQGFLWNHALDHGKTVRIYGEACIPQFDQNLNWHDIYQMHVQGNPFQFQNITTISRVRPILSTSYPGYDGHKIADQIRAEAFIQELKSYESMPGDQWPQLMIIALPADHTAGLTPGYPTPRAMVADNDLALGKMIEAITKSRFWDSTAVFITEDDSQSGWDHVSAYRTTCLVLSPYSRLRKTIHTNYNQTSMVRTIEQILGLPPMNSMDATAVPMSDCFTGNFTKTPYAFLMNTIPLDEMNKSTTQLKGKEKQLALLSAKQFQHVDGGDDDLLNRILWFAAKGNVPYPRNMTLPKKYRKDDDD